MSDEYTAESDQEQSRPAETGRDVGLCEPSLQDDRFLAGQLLRFRERYETGGELALQEVSRRKPIVKNRVEAGIETAVLALAIEKPALGQVRVSNEFKKQGLFVSFDDGGF